MVSVTIRIIICTAIIFLSGILYVFPSTTRTELLSNENNVKAQHSTRQLMIDPRTVESKEQKQTCQKTHHEQLDPDFKHDSSSYFKEYYGKLENGNNDFSLDMAIALCEEPIFEKIVDFAIQLKVKTLYVYSKCGQVYESKLMGDESNNRQVMVEFKSLINRGREGHTWIHHMLREDITFAKWTLFLQSTDMRDDGIHQPHTPFPRIVLATIIAYEHSEELQEDDTDFIDLSRFWGSNTDISNSVICAPRTEQIKSAFLQVKPQRWFYDRFKSDRDKSFEEAAREMTLYGEFLVRNDLIHNLNRTKFEYIQSILGQKASPVWGHYVEKTWIGLLGASDSCRCFN